MATNSIETKDIYLVHQSRIDDVCGYSTLCSPNTGMVLPPLSPTPLPLSLSPFYSQGSGTVPASLLLTHPPI